MDRRLTPVTSSNLDGFAYDPANRKLIIAFKKGTHYLYEGVPQVVVDGFIAAKSKGNFFSRNIRESYITHQLDNEGVDAHLSGMGSEVKRDKPKRRKKRTILPELLKQYPSLRATF